MVEILNKGEQQVNEQVEEEQDDRVNRLVFGANPGEQ